LQVMWIMSKYSWPGMGKGKPMKGKEV
jgi:hypothetical protein